MNVSRTLQREINFTIRFMMDSIKSENLIYTEERLLIFFFLHEIQKICDSDRDTCRRTR